MVLFDPAKKANYETLPQGTYVCRVEDIREKTSDRGTRWTIWFRVTEGEHENRIVFDDVFFYGKGLEHAGALLVALGRNPTDKQELLRKDVLDLVCNISVDIRAYEHDGESRTKNIVVSYDFASDDGDKPF